MVANGAGGAYSGGRLSSSNTKASTGVKVGNITLKRGRPRTAGQDPRALVKIQKSIAAPEVSGVDSYLDDDYLREERKRVYRPEDFHVAVKNEHDHDETIHVRIHPVMKAALEEMVRSSEFPISTPQDILRVGALELMKKLYYLRKVRQVGSSGHPTTNWIAQLETISRVLFRNEQLLSFEGSLDTLRKTVERFRRQGQLGERQAAKMVLDVRDAAKKLDPEWAEWYLKRIDDEYDGLIERMTAPIKRVRRSV